MRRREFLATLAAVPLAAIVPTSPTPIPGTWGAVVRSEVPMFRGGNPGGGKSYGLTGLEGVPYHYNDGTTGTWLGLSRE